MLKPSQYTASEILTVLSARQLSDGQVVFAGVGIPLLAATLAQRLGRPGLTILFEGGVIGAFIVFGLREYLSTLVPWWQYVLGAVYVLTIFYLPMGLMGIPERIRQRRATTGAREESKKLAPVTP